MTSGPGDPEGSDDVRLAGTGESSVALFPILGGSDMPGLGGSDMLDLPRSKGNLRDSDDIERSLSRKLSGGRPSSFAGSDWPMLSSISATSSEKDETAGG